MFAHRDRAAKPLEAEADAGSDDVLRRVVFADEDVAEDAERHVAGDLPVEVDADDQRLRSPDTVALHQLVDERRSTRERDALTHLPARLESGADAEDSVVGVQVRQEEVLVELDEGRQRDALARLERVTHLDVGRQDVALGRVQPDQVEVREPGAEVEPAEFARPADGEIDLVGVGRREVPVLQPDRPPEVRRPALAPVRRERALEARLVAEDHAVVDHVLADESFADAPLHRSDGDAVRHVDHLRTTEVVREGGVRTEEREGREQDRKQKEIPHASLPENGVFIPLG